MLRKITAFLCASFFVFSLACALPGDADAARMGGGKSFGSQPSMRAPAQKPAVQQQQSHQAQSSQPAAAAAAPNRGGLLGGFGGGLLGGLLAGSLLGALLGGGAFSGVGFMDILLLLIVVGGVIFFLRRKKAAAAAAEPAPAAAYGASSYQQQPPQNAAYDNGPMQRNDASASAWSALSSQPAPSAAAAPSVPADFDTEEFLRGAKMAYTRMQDAWDRRDINDIAHFATDSVLEELRRQIAEDPTPGQTQIVLINASLISVEEFGSMDRAQVYFDVLMRENPNQTQPANAREIWHFVRPHETGNWKLDGIQQIESC